jgi:hypothetical protein
MSTFVIEYDSEADKALRTLSTSHRRDVHYSVLFTAVLNFDPVYYHYYDY